MFKDMEEKEKKITRREKRMQLIAFIYNCEILKLPISEAEIDELYDFSKDQVQAIKLIAKHYDFFKKTIIAFLKSNWTWNSLFPLVRSILILGAFELLFLEKTIVINEMVEITKEFTLENDAEYKMINAILERIDSTYEKHGRKTIDSKIKD